MMTGIRLVITQKIPDALKHRGSEMEYYCLLLRFLSERLAAPDFIVLIFDNFNGVETTYLITLVHITFVLPFSRHLFAFTTTLGITLYGVVTSLQHL